MLLNAGTFNLTDSDLTVGAAGPFGTTAEFNSATTVNITNGNLIVEAGGTLSTHGVLTAQGGTNHGQISVTGGSLTYATPMTQTSTGTMNLIQATVTGGVTIDAGSQVFVANTATFNQAEDGDMFVNNGEVNVGGTATFNLPVSGSGDFTGSGTNIFNSIVNPGNSPGVARIEGHAVLGEHSTLILELAGTTLGTDRDHLDIAGTLTANGTLEIKLLNHFTPQPGDAFDLLDFASITGDFDSILLPTLQGGLTFDTSSLLTTGTLAVVPEPATLT